MIMNLITAFQEGQVEGISGKPEKTVETLLSELFFTSKKVYKVYKAKKNSFEDFSNFERRKNFYLEDFSWNREMSPSIYLALHGVRKNRNRWMPASTEEAEDFYIEMNRVDDSWNVSNLWHTNKITDQNLVQIATLLTQKHKALTDKKRDHLSDLFKRNLQDLILETSEDERNYGYFAPNISNEWTDHVVDTWKNFIEKQNYFSSFNSSDLQVTTDNHAKNILILNGKVALLDVLLPKKIWRVVDPAFSIVRIATDVVVLAGRQKADILYETYRKFFPLPPTEIITFYEIYNAFILTAYCQFIREPNLSEKYKRFIDANLTKLI